MRHQSCNCSSEKKQTFGTVASSVMGLILGLNVNDPGLRGSLKRKVWL